MLGRFLEGRNKPTFTISDIYNHVSKAASVPKLSLNIKAGFAGTCHVSKAYCL